MNWTIDDKTLDRIFDACLFKLSDILPSEWAEQNRYMTSDVSPMEGQFSFKNSPYTKEILDCGHQSNPAQFIVVMKGAQVGFSTSVLENYIGWIISENPGNTLLLVGHGDLLPESMKKIDNMLTNTGIRESGLIQSNSNRSKNNKSGDTDHNKEFAGGWLKVDQTNHKSLRQISVKYMLVDDFESMKSESKESGATISLIKRRTAAFAKKRKVFLISTPEIEETSNIEPEFLKGDQRKYFVPCPCCGDYITLEWDVDNTNDDGGKSGIIWEIDEDGRLIEDSVGYKCQECGGFFTDQAKSYMLENGVWKSTLPEGVKKLDSAYTSYHISNLYAPIFMDGWLHYVKEFLEANPPGQQRNEALHKTFVTTVLGQTYKPQTQQIDATSIQKNIRPYKVGIIPERQSIMDGNGRIVLLTFGSDLNGTAEDPKQGYVDDARFDWEVIAWSESGTSYSVEHGSIGTFQPASMRDVKFHNHPDRVKWSYKFGAEHCVWDEVDKLLSKRWTLDTGKSLPIFAAAIDYGHLSEYVNPYVENSQYNVYAVKGDKLQDSGIFINQDYKPFSISKDNAKLWILNVNRYKDLLATHIGLVWNPHITKIQPADFMNFPTPEDGKYQLHNYFSHFEAEHKVVDEKSKRFVWKKKTANAQNHLFDCRIYGMAARDIFINEIFKEAKVKNGTWKDYVAMIPK